MKAVEQDKPGFEGVLPADNYAAPPGHRSKIFSEFDRLRHLRTEDRPLDAADRVIQLRLTLMPPATATIRDLRNSFPKIRKLVESEGEVLLSESGRTKYRLTLHSMRPVKAPPPVDYWARLTAYQPVPLTRAQARALRDENRGDR